MYRYQQMHQPAVDTMSYGDISHRRSWVQCADTQIKKNNDLSLSRQGLQGHLCDSIMNIHQAGFVCQSMVGSCLNKRLHNFRYQWNALSKVSDSLITYSSLEVESALNLDPWICIHARHSVSTLHHTSRDNIIIQNLAGLLKWKCVWDISWFNDEGVHCNILT